MSILIKKDLHNSCLLPDCEWLRLCKKQRRKSQTTANSHRLQRLHSWKIPQTLKPQCANLRPYGKNGFRGTKDKQNIIICKFMINKHTNIYAHVCRNDISVPGWKLSGWSNSVGCMAEGDIENFEVKKTIFGLICLFLHVLIHPLLWWHDSLHVSLTGTHARSFPFLGELIQKFHTWRALALIYLPILLSFSLITQNVDPFTT